jgi:D-proline reductase (dithiol) PrdB
MRLRSSEMQPVAPAPWITPKPLKDCTVAIISTAGLHRRTDVPFKVGAVDYRLIPGDADFGDLVVSHISTNFDRSAYQQDPNIWFPLDRLREMAADGESGSPRTGDISGADCGPARVVKSSRN